MTDRVFLRGMVFFARHGVHAEEARLGQRFEVDLDCFLDLGPAAAADDADAAVRYDHLYETARKIVTGERTALIETVGARLADAVLARFDRVERVRVEIRKPGAPIEGVFETVGIEIDRSRHKEGGAR